MIHRRKLPYLRLLIVKLNRRIIKKRYKLSYKLTLKKQSYLKKINQQKQSTKNVLFKSVSQLQYPTYTSNYHLFQKLSQLIPTKLIGYPMPIYELPKKVKVVISKPDASKGQSQIFIPYQEDQHSNTLYEQISLQQYLQYSGNLHLSIAQMNLQKNLVQLPDFIVHYFKQTVRGITKNTIKAINLWYYKGKRISSWHYDGHDNFLFVIKGKKIIYLIQPNKINGNANILSSCFHRTKGVFDLNHNHSKIDNFDSFVCQKNCLRSQINIGQCLYIPRGWWHYVQSQGQPNIAINVWGNSIQNLLHSNDEEMLLKHLIFEVGDRISIFERNLLNIKQESLKQKEQHRKLCFSKYLNIITQ